MRALQLCLDLSHHPWTGDAGPDASAHTLALARAADGAGIDAIWVSEDPDGWDALAVLGAVAGVTSTARLGTGVTNPYLRHPNLLAASIATLDRLSGGRAVLGLGRGQAEWYERALGMEIGKPLAVLEETIGLLRQWWRAPHRASSDGHFAIRAWERTVRPLQPSPPIYLAAAGPKALDLAARQADGVIFNALTSLPFLRETIPQVRQDAAQAGRDSDRLAFVLRTPVTVTDDPAPVLERAKTQIALINALPGMDRLLLTPGVDVPAIIAEVRRLMRTDEVLAGGGAFPDLRREGNLPAARAAVPTDWVASLAIAGPLDHVRQRLRDIAAAGVTHVTVAPPSGEVTADAFAEMLAALRADGG